MTTKTKEDSSEATAFINNVRLSFPTLRRKQASVPGGKEKYSASFIIDPETPQGKAAIAACKVAIAAAEMNHFKKPGVVKTIDDPKRIAFRPGNKFKNAEGDVYAGYEGMVGVTSTSQKRPKLYTVQGAKAREEVEVEDIEDLFYGGVYCNAEVNFYCVSSKEQGGRGLFCEIRGIMTKERGEAFGGGAPVNSLNLLDDDDMDDGLGESGEVLDDDDDLLG